jgi:hypothetical protein
LWVGRTPADQSAAQFRRVAFRPGGGTFSRPSYLTGAGDRVLIVVDGDLYDVDLGSAGATKVELPSLAGPPVAVSVAPDGARVAIVTADRAYVATIDSSKTPAKVEPTAGAPIREVYLGGLPTLRGVGWYSEHQIVVGGRTGLMISAIDGGSLEKTGPANLLNAQLTQLSAVPWDPAGGSGGNVVIEAFGSNEALKAYRPYRQELTPIEAPTPGSSASSPSPSSSGPPVLPRVTAPFYADVI